MELSQKIIRQMQHEGAIVIEIVAIISEIFEEREIPRDERRRILDKVEQYLRLAWTAIPEHTQGFPHGTEPDDDYQIAVRAARQAGAAVKQYPSKLHFWPIPRSEPHDDHGESDDLVMGEPDPELERILAEEEEIERQAEQRRLEQEQGQDEEE